MSNSIYEDDMAFGNDKNDKNDNNGRLIGELYAVADRLGGDDGATIEEAIAELEGTRYKGFTGFTGVYPCEPNDNNSPAWEDRDAASDQAAQDALDIEIENRVDEVMADIERERDWQNAALIAQEEADYLRGVLAARDEQIDQMQHEIQDLKRSVLFLANNASLVKGMHDAARNTDRQLLVERRTRESCMARRQANENIYEEGN